MGKLRADASILEFLGHTYPRDFAHRYCMKSDIARAPGDIYVSIFQPDKEIKNKDGDVRVMNQKRGRPTESHRLSMS